MSDLNRLLELTEQITPHAFDDLVDVRRLRSRRARAATACGLATAAVVAVVGAMTLTDGSNKSEPAPIPTPTPSELFVIPEGQTTIPVDLRPGDVHGWDVLATVTNTQPEHLGATDLSTTVTVNAEAGGGQSPVSIFCRTSDEDIWLVYSQSGGAGGYGRCNEFPESFHPGDIGQGSDPGSPEPLTVRVHLTRDISQLRSCMEGNPTHNCFADYGRPLATADAEFGFRIYEHPRTRNVLTLWDAYTFEALSTIDGKGWIIEHAVVAAPGADRLAIALPDSDRQRLVGVYADNTKQWDTCVEEHEAELPNPDGNSAAWSAEVQKLCGVTLLLLVDGEYVKPVGGENSLTDFGEPVMYVAPGAHQVTVDVTGNDPRNVRFAVVIRKEQAQ